MLHYHVGRGAYAKHYVYGFHLQSLQILESPCQHCATDSYLSVG